MNGYGFPNRDGLYRFWHKLLRAAGGCTWFLVPLPFNLSPFRSIPYRPPSPLNVTPSMKYFWAKKNRARTGNNVNVAKAISRPGSPPRSP
jgi:hypothetical protein